MLQVRELQLLTVFRPHVRVHSRGGPKDVCAGHYRSIFVNLFDCRIGSGNIHCRISIYMYTRCRKVSFSAKLVVRRTDLKCLFIHRKSLQNQFAAVLILFAQISSKYFWCH
ncbi:hypothetical protein HanPI659440_Chr17g0684111 [Helianthus annuus]|nr:hypothetical protein HanPI659440_Chr17g0684111 [Helianthus annuus]